MLNTVFKELNGHQVIEHLILFTEFLEFCYIINKTVSKSIIKGRIAFISTKTKDVINETKSLLTMFFIGELGDVKRKSIIFFELFFEQISVVIEVPIEFINILLVLLLDVLLLSHSAIICYYFYLLWPR